MVLWIGVPALVVFIFLIVWKIPNYDRGPRKIDLEDLEGGE